MKITIVSGFFLPIPPLAGGATEKTWYRLAQVFAARGHEITIVSRTWEGLPDNSVSGGIRHLRLTGYDHSPNLRKNLWLDLKWSLRVYRHLPKADIVVVNSVALPVWLGTIRRSTGKVVIMTGRVPKGQYRWYRKISMVLAASTHIRSAVIAENPRLTKVTDVWGYPIDWQLMSAQSSPYATTDLNHSREVTIGYIGRIHREKGITVLSEAVSLLCKRDGLPPWNVLVCGPTEISRGGSGDAYANEIKTSMTESIGPSRVRWMPPQFDGAKLAAVYQSLDVFCLPSLSENGETFGVAAVEAMAAGAATVVSQLSCFQDFAENNRTALVFDHRSIRAAEDLAAALERLIRDPELRQRVARESQNEVARFDFQTYADSLLQNFDRLISSD